MGQKGVLWAWISVSKDMLRNYGTKGLINILVGQYIQDQTGIIYYYSNYLYTAVF